MKVSQILRAAQQQRTPMIKFLGKRKTPQSVDHTPHVHPASPSSSLPESFANYRTTASTPGSSNSGGPPKPQASSGSGDSSQSPPNPGSGPMTYGVVGGKPGRSLGPIEPQSGEVFDRNQLPPRFRKLEWTDAEMDAVGSGGATLWG